MPNMIDDGQLLDYHNLYLPVIYYASVSDAVQYCRRKGRYIT